MTNKNDIEASVAQKEGRYKKLAGIKTLDPEVGKPRIVPAINADGDETAAESSAGPKKRGRPRKDTLFGLKAGEEDRLPKTAFNAHYHISEARTNPEDLVRLAADNQHDPGLKVRRDTFARLFNL